MGPSCAVQPCSNGEDMSNKPLSLIKKGPNKSVIKFLEETLEDAKSGDVMAVVIVCAHSDGCVSSSWAGIKNCATRLVGKLFTTATDIANQINAK